MDEKYFEGMKKHGNKHGFRGVEYDTSRGKYRARIVNDKARGKWLGRFDTAKEAALAYDEAAREIYGDHAYLNFPTDDERKAIQTLRPLGLCINQHPLSKFGHERKDGKGINCRKCNAESAKRSYYLKKSRDNPGSPNLAR